MIQSNENIFRGARALRARARVIYMVVAAIFLSLTISAISASVFTPAAFADDTLLVAQSATSDDAVNAGADDSAGTPVDQAISGAEGGDFSTPLTTFASLEMTKGAYASLETTVGRKCLPFVIPTGGTEGPAAEESRHYARNGKRGHHELMYASTSVLK